VLLALSIASTVSAQVTITGSQKAGPVRLVCLNPDGLISHVNNLARNQIIGINYAARNGKVRWPCDDVQLPVGTVVLHERWVQTRDRWWVLGQTVQYPNGAVMVTVDPLQTSYRRQPMQFLRFYGDYFVPIAPGYNNGHQYNPQVQTQPAPVPKLDIDEKQRILKELSTRELKRLLGK